MDWGRNAQSPPRFRSARFYRCYALSEKGVNPSFHNRRLMKIITWNIHGAQNDSAVWDVLLNFHADADEKIERTKIEWERDFVQTGKVPFEEAVAQYRKCKESAAATA